MALPMLNVDQRPRCPGHQQAHGLVSEACTVELTRLVEAKRAGFVEGLPTTRAGPQSDRHKATREVPRRRYLKLKSGDLNVSALAWQARGRRFEGRQSAPRTKRSTIPTVRITTSFNSTPAIGARCFGGNTLDGFRCQPLPPSDSPGGPYPELRQPPSWPKNRASTLSR